MAHFAEVENNIVKRVIVISNDDCGGGDFPASEPVGQEFIASLGISGYWMQTSFSGSFRKALACPDSIYDATLDGFIPPKPIAEGYESNFDETNWKWLSIPV
jgi:hypothetical protein